MKGSLVIISRTLPFHGHGGMETHAWQLAQAWKRRGWEVEILTTSFEDRSFVKDVDGVRVHALRHLPLNRREVPNWRWWHRFAARARDYAIAHRIDADLVHSESVYGHALFRTLRRRRAPIGRVMTIHGTSLQTYRDTSRRQLLKEVSPWHPRAIGQWIYVKQR
ncbi:MAG TPA: glycosyltransferase family 4 protein, partial [Candidatus Thermoplasmatota archaeon]|nr:glycosyltransferase family 4 protein [Candidatus Thermoplasmatota archaeon]